MRRYVEGGEDSLNCEVRRYNTGGIVMRWPAMGAQEHDVWFTCTLRHSKGTFIITTFLRHTPSAPVGGQVDSLQRLTVNDRDLLTTSGNRVDNNILPLNCWSLMCVHVFSSWDGYPDTDPLCGGGLPKGTHSALSVRSGSQAG